MRASTGNTDGHALAGLPKKTKQNGEGPVWEVGGGRNLRRRVPEKRGCGLGKIALYGPTAKAQAGENVCGQRKSGNQREVVARGKRYVSDQEEEGFRKKGKVPFGPPGIRLEGLVAVLLGPH